MSAGTSTTQQTQLVFSEVSACQRCLYLTVWCKGKYVTALIKRNQDLCDDCGPQCPTWDSICESQQVLPGHVSKTWQRRNTVVTALYCPGNHRRPGSNFSRQSCISHTPPSLLSRRCIVRLEKGPILLEMCWKRLIVIRNLNYVLCTRVKEICPLCAPSEGQ